MLYIGFGIMLLSWLMLILRSSRVRRWDSLLGIGLLRELVFKFNWVSEEIFLKDGGIGLDSRFCFRFKISSLGRKLSLLGIFFMSLFIIKFKIISFFNLFMFEGIEFSKLL